MLSLWCPSCLFAASGMPKSAATFWRVCSASVEFREPSTAKSSTYVDKDVFHTFMADTPSATAVNILEADLSLNGNIASTEIFDSQQICT